MKESNDRTAEIVNRGNTLYLHMSQPQLKAKRSRFWLWASLAVLVIGYSIHSCKSTPRFLSNGTVITQSQLRGYGKLFIDNGTERDAVVKLVKPTDKRAIASVYVRARSKAELAGIPDGSYEIFVTQGSDWDSAVAKFTRSASYSKFEKITDFVTRTVEQKGLPTQQTSIWTFTLHPVPLGNARTEAMSESEFDRY